MEGTVTPPGSSRPAALRESDHRRVVFNEKPLMIGEKNAAEKESPKSEGKAKGKGKWRTRPFKKGGKGKKGGGKGGGKDSRPKEGEKRSERSPTPPKS